MADSSKPMIFFLALKNKRHISETFAPLLSVLHKSSRLFQVKGFTDVFDNLSLNLDAVIIAEPSIFEDARYMDALRALINYVRQGGTVILACGSSSTRQKDLDACFANVWGLPWRHGGLNYNTFTLNPTTHAARLLDRRTQLPGSYNGRVHYLHDVAPEGAVYVNSNAESKIRSSPSDAVMAVPVAFTQIEHGFLGYIGDTTVEDGTVKIIVAMCNI
jgi:hypothetical protein